MQKIVRVITSKVLRRYQKYFLDFPNTVMIETTSVCNRKCSFCFNADSFNKRDQGFMNTDLWYKIIDDLAAMHYAGRISPHFYGEPLLDKRLPDLISYARKQCPFAHLRFSSNGDLLTEGILLKLIDSGIDKILVTNYDDSKDNDRVIELSKKYSAYLMYRNYKDINLINRAGGLFERNNKKMDSPCLRPTWQLVINWKGNIVLCCNDFYESHIFGSATKDALLDIWNSKQLIQTRKVLQKSNSRNNIAMCKNCDL